MTLRIECLTIDDETWVVLTDPEGNEFCILCGKQPA